MGILIAHTTTPCVECGAKFYDARAQEVHTCGWASEQGPCWKCGGSGEYKWGAIVNGVPSHVGVCFRCDGTGTITAEKSMRNNYHDNNCTCWRHG